MESKAPERKTPESINILDLHYPIAEGVDGYDLYMKHKPWERAKAFRMDEYYKVKGGEAFFCRKTTMGGAMWCPKTVDGETPIYTLPSGWVNKLQLPYDDDEDVRNNPDHSAFKPTSKAPGRNFRVRWSQFNAERLHLFDKMRREFLVANWDVIFGKVKDDAGNYFMDSYKFTPAGDDDPKLSEEERKAATDNIRREYIGQVGFGITRPWEDSEGNERLGCNPKLCLVEETVYDYDAKKKAFKVDPKTGEKVVKLPRTFIAEGTLNDFGEIAGFKAGSSLGADDMLDMMDAGNDGKAAEDTSLTVLVMVRDKWASFFHLLTKIDVKGKKKGPAKYKMIPFSEESQKKSFMKFICFGVGVQKTPRRTAAPEKPATADRFAHMLAASGIGFAPAAPIAEGPTPPTETEGTSTSLDSFAPTDPAPAEPESDAEPEPKKRGRKAASGGAKKRAKKGE